MTDVVDPFAPDALEDPYGLYDYLQREEPVTKLPGNSAAHCERSTDV